MLSKILRGAILATFAVGATVAQADPFSGSNTGYLSYAGQPGGAAPASISSPHLPPANATNVSAGLMSGYFDNNGVGTTNEAINFFYFFCIDLAHYATSAYLPYTRTTPPALDPGDIAQLQNLFDKYAPSGNTLGIPLADHAALQLAIWNIIYDTDTTIASGNFTATSGVSGTADAMLAASLTAVAPADQWTYTFYRFASTPAATNNNASQDYLAFERVKSSRDLPLPGTLALFGIGLAGLGLARRKS
jgi:hypothetical protein